MNVSAGPAGLAVSDGTTSVVEGGYLHTVAAALVSSAPPASREVGGSVEDVPQTATVAESCRLRHLCML